MPEGDTAVTGPPAPGRRRAGDLAVAELMRAQASVPARGPFARAVGSSPLSEETNAMYRAVLGEVEVGEALDRLGPGWIVVHAIPQAEGAADIDHLVVGPPGVVLVSTRTHRGLDVWASARTLMVGGVRQSAIRDMEFEMGHAERVLGIAVGRTVLVSGVLAVVAASSVTVVERHRDVAVLPASALVAWLRGAPVRLGAREVAEVGVIAARAGTWSIGSGSPAVDEESRAAFEDLRAEVRAAARTQRSWIIGAAILGVVALIAMTWTIVAVALGSAGL